MTRTASFLLVFLALSVSAWAQTTVGGTSRVGGVTQVGGLTTGGGGTPAGCGAGFDGSTCGNVGYTGLPLSSPTHLTACDTNITTGGNYILDNDIGADATAVCLWWQWPSAAVSLDLNGFTVTGKVALDTNYGNNLVEHGFITCSRTAEFCLSMGMAGDVLRWVTVHQQSATADGAIWWGYTVGSPPVAPASTIYHVTSTVDAAPGVTRIRNIMASGGNGSTTWSTSPEVHDCLITCSTDAAACQGVEYWEAPYAYAHHNEFNLPASCSGCGDNSRAIIFDTGSDHADASYNVIHTHSNRALRVRTSTDIALHHNEILDIQYGGYYGAIHLGNASTSSPETSVVTITDNTLEMGAGNGISAVDVTGPTANNNTATCVSGNCAGAGYIAKTEMLDSTSGASTLTIHNTTVPGTYGNAVYICGPGGGGACYQAAQTTTGHVCNTGTVVGGGTIVVDSPCP